MKERASRDRQEIWTGIKASCAIWFFMCTMAGKHMLDQGLFENTDPSNLYSEDQFKALKQRFDSNVEATAVALSTPQNWNKESRTIPPVARNNAVNIDIFKQKDKGVVHGSSCSGLIIGRANRYDILLTAKHCVETQDSIFGINIRKPQLKNSKLDIVYKSKLKIFTDPDRDLAVVFIDRGVRLKTAIYTPLAIDRIKASVEYYGVTFPGIDDYHGMSYIPFKGKFDRIGYGWATSKSITTFGASGSGMVDKRGVVHGVAAFIDENPDRSGVVTIGSSFKQTFENGAKALGFTLPKGFFVK